MNDYIRQEIFKYLDMFEYLSHTDHVVNGDCLLVIPIKYPPLCVNQQIKTFNESWAVLYSALLVSFL